jgi:hypothetical protein
MTAPRATITATRTLGPDLPRSWITRVPGAGWGIRRTWAEAMDLAEVLLRYAAGDRLPQRTPGKALDDLRTRQTECQHCGTTEQSCKILRASVLHRWCCAKCAAAAGDIHQPPDLYADTWPATEQRTPPDTCTDCDDLGNATLTVGATSNVFNYGTSNTDLYRFTIPDTSDTTPTWHGQAPEPETH